MAAIIDNSSPAADDDVTVQFQLNPIDASKIGGSYNTWQLKGEDSHSAVVNPANSTSPPIFIAASALHCYGQTNDIYKYTRDPNDIYKYTRDPGQLPPGAAAALSELREAGVTYTQEEPIILTGPVVVPGEDGKTVVQIDMTGTLSGIVTSWILQQ